MAGEGKGKDKDEDDDQDDDLSETASDNESSEEIYVFHQGDGKVNISDFDLGDVIRLEGFDSDDILVKSKGENVEVTIVGDKNDKLTFNAPRESDSNSYSITQSDDGGVFVTLDSE